jgi:regulatory protein
MPQITKLKAGVRRPDRVNVEVDGRYFTSLSLEEVIKNHLSVGQVLTEEACHKLKSHHDSELTYGRIINYLSYRPRSIQEVKNKLKHSGVPDLQVQSTLARLKDNGLLDDHAFARWFVSSRREHRPRSHLELTRELRQKGIAKDVIQEVLGSDSDQAALLAALTKKTHGHLPTDSPGRARLIRFLAARGFRYHDIQAALGASAPEVED